jgi:hypothetical protein
MMKTVKSKIENDLSKSFFFINLENHLKNLKNSRVKITDIGLGMEEGNVVNAVVILTTVIGRFEELLARAIGQRLKRFQVHMTYNSTVTPSRGKRNLNNTLRERKVKFHDALIYLILCNNQKFNGKI